MKDQELRESHVIPKFVARWLKETSATGYLRQGIQSNLRKQDFSTEHLLCNDCENRISKWENLFAETIFFPYLNDGKREFEYKEWLLKFSVSLIWRLGVSELENFRGYQPQLTSHLEQALSVWRNYLLDDTPMQESYGFHLFFIDFVKSVQGGTIPEGFHWYTLRGVDGTLPANDTEVYGYVKLPAMAFFSGVTPRRPSKFKNTRIFESGKIRAANQVVLNPVFGEFYLDRARQAWEMTKATSLKQQEKIRETINGNPERNLQSESFRVFLAEEYWKSKQNR
ncbi:MAG TPA: hypothetical protein VJ987_15260 [Anaerolineales bacterium]|nr:hypothetical protein [Anaerolineales bacterium]